MTFTLAYAKSAQKVLLRQFKNSEEENDKGILMDWEELSSQSVDALVYPAELREDEEFMSELIEENRFFPVRTAGEMNLDYERFEGMDDDSAFRLLEKVNRSWVLQNNVMLLDELFKVIEHLKNLFPNDRTAFFEELWFLLKSNLGAEGLKLVYNDLDPEVKENERNRLIRVKIDGTRNPEPQPGGDFADKLMEEYAASITKNFEIVEYDSVTGQLVATATINKSPVIIMARVFSLTRIQQALLKSLFDGFQATLH